MIDVIVVVKRCYFVVIVVKRHYIVVVDAAKRC